MGESQIRHQTHFAPLVGAVAAAFDEELMPAVTAPRPRDALRRSAPLPVQLFGTWTQAMDPAEWNSAPRRVARHLPADPYAGRTARRVLDEVCTRWGLDGLRDVAQMIVTELATNAVEHVGPPIELGITVGCPALRIEMSDSSSVLPALLDSSCGASRGHGLRLVDSLAGRWGVTATRWGKTVWVDLAAIPRRISTG